MNSYRIAYQLPPNIPELSEPLAELALTMQVALVSFDGAGLRQAHSKLPRATSAALSR